MVIPGLLILITQTTQEGINEPAKETPLLTSALVQFSHTQENLNPGKSPDDRWIIHGNFLLAI